MLRLVMHRAAAVLAVGLLVACVNEDSSTNPVSTDIAGSYSLRSVNGKVLPLLIGVSGDLKDSLSLIDDTYTLTGDSRFSEIFHTRRVQAGTVTTVAGADSGTFTRTGQALRMVGQNGVFSAQIKSDTLQLDGENTTFVYRK